MVAIVCLSASGVGVREVLRRLGLGQDHRQRVADHVVHVAGQAGLLVAEPGDLAGLLGLALGAGGVRLGHLLRRPRDAAARSWQRSTSPASQGTAEHRHAG